VSLTPFPDTGTFLCFFTIGAGEGGWEYDALLITCNLVTIWENRKRPLW
jgi:hypothetical protein